VRVSIRSAQTDRHGENNVEALGNTWPPSTSPVASYFQFSNLTSVPKRLALSCLKWFLLFFVQHASVEDAASTENVSESKAT
jgi:hypothetical protein